jgi:adenylate cyclase
VVAEAGVGKSRLCFEFLERCRARGDLLVLEGHAVAHGRHIPFLPILEIIRGYYGITDQDDDRTAREKIAGRMLLFDEAYREVLPLIFEFLGVPDPERPAPRMDPEARQRQLFAVLRRVLQGGDRRPGVALIEDLHWLDDGSAAWLAQWADAIAGSHNLLVVNSRPEYHADWMQRSYSHQIALAPLAPEAIRELLDDLLGCDPSIEGLAEAIHARTGGNPFFTEEVVRSLIESGHLEGSRGAYRLVTPVEKLAVPGSVHSVLAARIDRLSEREKHVLQTAAVIGKEFAEPILEAVADLPSRALAEALGVLSAAEFIYEEALYPVAQYAFKHPLTRDVALASQLHDRRRGTHENVARAIEEAYADKLGERAALIAHHWEEADEALQAARWHARAADWVRPSDAAQSIRHWQKVRELVAPLPETDPVASLRMRACLDLVGVGAWKVGLSQREEDAVFAEGKALAERRGNTSAAAGMAIAYANRLTLLGDATRSLEPAGEAIQVASQSSHPDHHPLSLTAYVYAQLGAGQLAEALESANRAIELVDEDLTIGVGTVGFSVLIWALIFRGTAETWLGHIEPGRRDLDRAIRLARDRDDHENLVWALGNSVTHAELSGEVSNMRPQALQCLEIAERLGGAFHLTWGLHSLGTALLLHEEWGEAIDTLEASLRVARDHRTGLEREARMLAHLAGAYLGAGRVDPARRAAGEAIRVGSRGGALHHEAEAQLSLARVLLATEGLEARPAIEGSLARALELVERTRAVGLEPQVLVERAHLARLVGDGAAGDRHLREAHRLYTEMGATGHAERVAREQGS